MGGSYQEGGEPGTDGQRMDDGSFRRRRLARSDRNHPRKTNFGHLLRQSGGGWRWGGFGDATTTTETYKVGTLVVDIFDAKTKKLLWRGSSRDTLSGKPEQNEKKLNKGVMKMFDHFPPGRAQIVTPETLP